MKSKSKQLLLTLPFLLMGIGSSSLMAGTYSGGDGSELTPYEISTVEDLLELDTTTLDWKLGYYFVLTADLDMDGETFTPIGYGDGAGQPIFIGNFDGQNNVISNLTITPRSGAGNNDGIGLFGGFQGTIENLGLDSVDVQASGMNRAAPFIGQTVSGVTFKLRNCFSLGGTVVGAGWISGLIGAVWATGTVSNCFSSVAITANWKKAGLIGAVEASGTATTVDSVAFYGTINGGEAIAMGADGTYSRAYFISTCGATDDQGIQLSPSAMTIQASYDFDFTDVWTMKTDGYAVLASFPIEDFDDLPGPGPNSAPVANAGDAQLVVSGVEVTLDGTGSSDVDLDELSYAWTADAGITLVGDDTEAPTFTAPTVTESTEYEISLVVNDGEFDSDADLVVITVMPAGSDADTLETDTWSVIYTSSFYGDKVGENTIDGDISTKWVTDWSSGTDVFPLEIQYDMGRRGEISYFTYYSRQDDFGPNGTIKGYEFYVSDDSEDWGTAVKTGELEWPEVEADNVDDFKEVRIINLDTDATGRYIRFVATSAVTADQEATIAELYTFGSYVNSFPVADAGADQSVLFGTTVTLDASASSDFDSDPITYLWAPPAGITLSDNTSESPTFTAPTVTEDTDYTFSLVVNDGSNNSLADEITVTVRAVSSISNSNRIGFTVYPNPSSGTFNIRSETSVNFEVKDILGRQLMNSSFEAGTNQIDLSAYGSGLYFLIVHEGNQISTYKLKVM